MKDWREGYEFYGFHIRPDMLEGLNAYIETGRPTGGFLEAVLSNDLMAACDRADDGNRRNLPAYCGYLYNEAPIGCYGSPEAVKKWMAAGGLEGMAEPVPDPDAERCSGPDGHEWATDEERDRVYCVFCGADGDG
jgi:hypothetical protein